jgi:septal ring factor EnvC (AmiA/AmiB activator)
VALTPGQSTTLPVPEVVARQTTMSLTTLTRAQLTVFASGATPAQVREKLEQIVGLQEQLSELRATVTETQGTIDRQFTDQERLRENLKALRTGVEDQQMRSRYLGQLRKQEDQIDAAREKITSLNTQIVALQGRLNEAIANLTWNG